jgi:hypothetical protein
LSDLQNLQTGTSTAFNLLDYGAIPTEKWGWIDFGVGATLGLYFPLRNQLQYDCFSGILQTAYLFVDINKFFDKQPETELDWLQFSIEPLFATYHFALAF